MDTGGRATPGAAAERQEGSLYMKSLAHALRRKQTDAERVEILCELEAILESGLRMMIFSAGEEVPTLSARASTMLGVTMRTWQGEAAFGEGSRPDATVAWF